MIDEPTFRAQSLNFLYPQFKTPSMTDSWCVCRIASNDHEPLIAHPGSYDADRCIHRNNHGQPRGRIAPAAKEAAVLVVVVTIAKGYDLGYIWKTQGVSAERTTGGYYLDAAQAGELPGRWWGPGAQALGLTPGQAAWHQAFAALSPASQPDVRAMPRWTAMAPARQLRRPDRLGTPPRRQRVASVPARRLRRRPRRYPRRRRS
jgi:hypothetical protein